MSGTTVSSPAAATTPPAAVLASTPAVMPTVGVAHIGYGHAMPRLATLTTLWTKRSTITAGGALTLVGTTVFGDDDTRMRADVLRLQVRRAGAWTTIASRLPSSEGYVTYTVRPTESTTYRLVYDGSAALAASTSAPLRVTVWSGTAAAASVSTPASTSASAPVSVPNGSKVATVLATAAAQLGKPYRYGGAGPSSFDCSGLTQYVYAKVGVNLPHKADAQKSYGRAVSAANALPGDLVVFLDGGYAYHVGIYAGDGYMYDAPHSGAVVSKRKIFGSNVIFRRLL